jgi:predicted enzyme related to lactoylglutathione lyase
MPARTKYEPGTPSWVDLMTPDPAAAKTFYTALFGWEYRDEDTGMPDNPYTMCLKNGKSVAGMGRQFDDQRAQGVPPLWNSYVTVRDIEKSAAKAAKLGGSVMAPPMDVMDAGRMSVLVDPTGAVISIWQAKDHIGAELVNEHGTLTWNELMTSDIDAAAKFYEGLFGWKAEAQGVGPMVYTMFMLGDRGIAGGMKRPHDAIPSNWAPYFAVDDCDAAVETAKGLGATVFMGPFDGPPGRMAALADPQGAMFSVLKHAEQPD